MLKQLPLLSRDREGAVLFADSEEFWKSLFELVRDPPDVSLSTAACETGCAITIYRFGAEPV